MAFSASLWLMPFSQGTKIIAVGAMSARLQASWPAPEVMSRCAAAQIRAIEEHLREHPQLGLFARSPLPPFFASPAGRERLLHPGDECRRVCPEGTNQEYELDNIETALAGLDV